MVKIPFRQFSAAVDYLSTAIGPVVTKTDDVIIEAVHPLTRQKTHTLVIYSNFNLPKNWNATIYNISTSPESVFVSAFPEEYEVMVALKFS